MSDSKVDPPVPGSPADPAQSAAPTPAVISPGDGKAADSKETAPADKKPGSDTPKPAIPRRRKWARRLGWVAAAVILLAVIARLLLIVLLPPVIQKVASRYNLRCTYERMELYLVDGDVGLWHLALTPAEGGEPILSTDYCRAHVAIMPLLRGQLVVRRAEAEGADLLVERKADGTIPLLTRLPANLLSGQTAAAPKAQASRMVDLAPPLQIDIFRLQSVRAHLKDAHVSPALDTQFELNLRLTDLGSSSRPSRFSMDLNSAELLDSLRVEGEGKSSASSLDATLRVETTGLHLHPAEGYLRAIGIEPAAESISLRLDASIHATPAAQPGSVAAKVAVTNLTATADAGATLAVKHVDLDADAFDGATLKLSRVAVNGVRATAARLRDGGIAVGGVTIPDPSKLGSGAPAQSSPISVSLAAFDLKDLVASFHDAAIVPAADLSIVLESLSGKNLSPDPAHPEQAAEFTVRLKAPGIIGSAQIDGQARPFATQPDAKLVVRADGIRPEALRPYLDAFGLESQLKNATFTCNVDALLASRPGVLDVPSARVSNLRLTDGSDLMVLDDLQIAGLTLEPARRRISVKTVDVVGPRLSARRDANGVFEGLGLRTRPRPLAETQPAVAVAPATSKPAIARSTAPATPSTSPSASLAAILPRLEVGRFTWNKIGLKYIDATVQPPTTLDLTDAGFDLNGLLLDPDPAAKPAAPAKIHAHLAAPGLARSIQLDGTITPRVDGPTLELEVKGEGLTGAALAGPLKSIGLEPALKDGSLHLRTKVAVSALKNAAGIGATISLDDMKLEDAGQELVAVGSAGIEGLEVRSTGLAVQTLRAENAHAAVLREAGGALVFGGLRKPPAPPSLKQTGMLSAKQSAESQVDPLSQIINALGSLAQFPVSVKQIRIGDGALAWTDQMVSPAVQTTAHATASLDGLVLGQPGAPAQLKASASADGIARQLVVSGTISADPKHPVVHLDLTGEGITGAAAAPYLPPGTQLTLKDGRFTSSVDISLQANAAGGSAATLAIGPTDYLDGAGTPPLFHLGGMRAVASRVDLPGSVIAVQELSTSDLDTEVHSAADGLHLLGLKLSSSQAPGATTRPTTAPHAAATTAPSSVPEVPVAAAVTPATLPSAADVLLKLPLVTLEKLDLGLRRAAYIDDTRPKSAPIELRDVHVRNRKPVEVLGSDPDNRPPTEIEVTGRLLPVADQFVVTVQAAPFAPQPAAQGEIHASGIHGAGLISLVPELKDQIDGSTLKDGRFKVAYDAQAKLHRLRPFGFDLTKPIEAEFSVKNLELRDGENGPLLGGLDEIRGEGVRIEPTRGDVLVHTLELTKPLGSALRDRDGLHILGLTIKLPPELMWGAPPGSTPVALGTKPTTVPVAVASPAPAQAATTRPSNTIRIDRLTISGADLRIDDKLSDPEVMIPVTGLELEVRDVSNQIMYESRPVKFSLAANSGKMTLPRRAHGGVDAGTQQRELFAQMAADGSVAMYPAPTGWAKASTSALDLAGFRGVGHAIGVTLNGGNVDTATDIRFPGDGTMETRSRIVFTDLSVDEPAGGPIQKALKLPLPLDGAIGAVQDADGSVTIPMSYRVEKGHLNADQIWAQSLGVVSQVFLTAIAGAPVKAVGGVAALFGAGGKKGPLDLVALQFEPGETVTNLADVQALLPLLKALREEKTIEITIKHELGGADVTQAARRANPSAEDASAMAYNLRQRKMQLVAARSSAAGEARGQLGSRSAADASDALQRVKTIDRELAQTEDALDNVYELLRPGADRQIDRRTRAACIEIGQKRLDAVRALLLSSNIPGLDKRVHLEKVNSAASEGSEMGRVIVVPIKKKE